MILEEVNTLEKPLLEELAKHETQLRLTSDKSFYNGVGLMYDESYNAILLDLYKPYVTALLDLIEEQGIANLSDILEIKLERLRLIHYDQENRRLAVTGRLTELKNNLSLLKKNIHLKPALLGKLHDTNALCDTWERYAYMLNLQLSYIEKLTRIYTTGKEFNEVASSANINIKYDPALFQTRITWLKAFSKLLDSIEFLQKYGHISNLTSSNVNHFISLFNFIEGEPRVEKNTEAPQIKFDSNSDKILWCSKKVDFACFYWWLATNEYIEIHQENTLARLVKSLVEIFEFKKASMESKNPEESLRKTIQQFEKDKIINFKVPDNPFTDSLSKHLHSE